MRVDLELAVLHAARQRDAALARAPERRRALGIVHTPPELARGLLGLVDEVLRERFALRRGLSDRVDLVDPACGPGAFLASALTLAGRSEQPPAFSLTGFDVDASALRACRRVLGPVAGASLRLERADVLAEPQRLVRAGSAGRVLVIVGNPPWATVRSQPTPAGQQLLEDFRRDADGVRLLERKLGVLSDSYVRFFRVCAEAARVHRAGAVVALITNASFLDGPVHRGMRAALLRWFDALSLVDLGGSALLQRVAAQRDDNVFGVRPAVAISLLCRDGRSRGGLGPGRVGYARLRGQRHEKLERLRAGSAGLGLRSLQPQPPLWRFVPTGAVDAEYARWPSLEQCFGFQREGVQSNRDAVVVAFDREQLLSRLRAFAAGSRDVALAPALRTLAHYDPRRARTAVAQALARDPDGRLGISVRALSYRPFDLRWFCPVGPLCHRPRPQLQAAMDHSRWALVSVRKDRGEVPWSHAAISCVTIDNCLLSTRSSCRARAFPTHGPQGQDNLAPGLAALIGERTGDARADAQAFSAYALCFLLAPSYRARYDAQLRQDYPRIPLPASAEQFRSLIERGRRLSELFTAPIAPLGRSQPPPGARFSELVVEPQHGRVRLQGQTVVEDCEPGLRLVVGHHRPLASYVAARSARALGATELSNVRGLSARLQALALEIAALDAVVSRALP